MYKTHLYRSASGRYVELNPAECLAYEQLVKAVKSIPKKSPRNRRDDGGSSEVDGNHIYR